jgi:hypothetical protein
MSNHLISGRLDTASRNCAPLVLFACVAMAMTGCAERKSRAFPWATAIVVHPRGLEAAPGYQPDRSDDDAPVLTLDFPPPPSKLAIVKFPARPRVYVPPPADTPAPEKPESFSLSPQMSEPEIAAARKQMDASISQAQKNLDAAKGRKLNPAQADLAAKVHSFIEEAHGAARDGDWNRAKNLAKKAEVLSDELAESL